tara:strand:+ start:9351 stop:9785 length:435 start_codon:yes stop_codon:yes gene_type:complete
MNKKEAEKRARQIAADMEGPVGRMPLERVFAAHVSFFEELRSVGATWPQITTLLGSAGVTKKDGGTLSGGQIRAMISRIVSKDSAATQRPLPRTQPATSQTPPSESHSARNIASKSVAQKRSSRTDSIRKMMQRAAKARSSEDT